MNLAFCEDLMENIHWFWPKTIEYAYNRLGFICFEEIICFWKVYNQFRDMVLLLHNIGMGILCGCFGFSYATYLPCRISFKDRPPLICSWFGSIPLGKLDPTTPPAPLDLLDRATPPLSLKLRIMVDEGNALNSCSL